MKTPFKREVMHLVEITETSFPLLIKTSQGKRIICSTPTDLPASVDFVVLETNCDIEIRYLPAIREE